MWLSIICLITAHIFSIGNQIGWAMQKQAGYMTRYRTLIWLTGFLLMMINSIVGLLILPFIDMTLLASV